MSRAFHCDALDTSHAYIRPEIKFDPKRATKLKELGPNSPLGALAAEMEAQYVQVSTCNIPAMWPIQLDPNQVPQGWPWPSWAPKRDFMAQRGHFCGLQECCRGPLRGPST